MKRWYKTDCATILINSGAVLTFGMGRWAAAKDAAELLGWKPADLLKLGNKEAALAVREKGIRKLTLVNYLKDAMSV